jgi:beta-1,4-mannosyl-glycoprotein beta-1,4-N-acetylglucosaminyltransferase
MFKSPFLRRLLPAPRRRRRVDACILCNELDLLTLRFEELWDEIDHFVVVEANATFSGQPKPLFFRKHSTRFKAYVDKVLYRAVTHLPPLYQDSENARFAREAAQRDAIGAAVESLPVSPRDIVIISDVDEIPRASRLANIESALSGYDYAIFMLRNYRGYINNISDRALNGATFAGPVACRVRTLRCVGAEQVRVGQQKSAGVIAQRSPEYFYIDNGGWHFSSLGGPDAFWLKAASFSHLDDPYRVIRLAEKIPEQQVFSADLNRTQCRDNQRRYLAHCADPSFSRLDFDVFEFDQDVPRYLRRNKERFRGFFFFTDLV